MLNYHLLSQVEKPAQSFNSNPPKNSDELCMFDITFQTVVVQIKAYISNERAKSL